MKNFTEFAKLLPSMKNRTPRGTAVVAGGTDSGNVIEYFQIGIIGNASDFGDLVTSPRIQHGGLSNGGNNRGVFGGGSVGGNTNSIEYIDISTPSNAQDFGDLTVARNGLCATSSGINDRGIFCGGYTGSYVNIVDYITVSSESNAQDFGDLSYNTGVTPGSTSNATGNIGVVFGGLDGPTRYNTICYISINTLSNAQDFGDITTSSGTSYNSATSNGVNNRGVLHEAFTTGSLNVLSYITITSPSNAQDFGDLTSARYADGATSNGIGNYGVFCGGGPPSNVIDRITITSLGNAEDFGDLSIASNYKVACSNA